MSSKEIAIAVGEAVDVINAAAIDLRLSPGGVALTLLRREDLPLITKKAALIVRTKELIKQNPRRESRRSGA